MRRPPALAAVALAAALLAGTAACSGDDGAGPTTTTPPTTTTTTTTTSTTTTIPGTDGAAGVGDPYFPGAGNSGYDVTSYDLRATVQVAGRDRLDATSTIVLTPTEDLRSFHLDLFGFDVSSVTVDGAPAGVAREAAELVVTPAEPLAAGTPATVVVAYAGTPGFSSDDVGFPENGGWIDLGDDYSVVMAEPVGAATWMPVNDHPSDKATFSITATVPAPLEAVSNGRLRSRIDEGATTTFSWQAVEPMAPYLMTLAVGDLELVAGEAIANTDPGPVEVLSAHPAGERARYEAAFAAFPDMVRYFSGRVGPYPFADAGNVVVPGLVPTALETQTRPVFSPRVVTPGIIAHELAHQWFGDSVTPATWRDIWLNEGLATWAEWTWEAVAEGEPLRGAIQAAHDSAGPAMDVPPADPGVDELFGDAVYQRAGIFVVLLEERMGTAAFDTLLQRWTTEFRYGTATTAQFLALAQEVAGEPIDDLSGPWLFEEGLPDLPA